MRIDLAVPCYRVVLERDTLDRMLSHKKDIVAGLCTRRIDPPEPVIRRWNETIQNYEVILKWPQGQLLEVDAVGTGVILLSRQVIEDVAVAFHKEEYEMFLGNGFWFEFLKGPQGNEWGEDVSFCWKARRLGYRIYVDTSINPGHVGEYPYGVNDYLCYQEEVLKAGGLRPYREANAKKEKAEWPMEVEI